MSNEIYKGCVIWTGCYGTTDEIKSGHHTYWADSDTNVGTFIQPTLDEAVGALKRAIDSSKINT